MNSIAKTLVAAAMGAVGVLTLMNVASAQEATTDTPAVEAPADTGADAADTAGEDCPERDGAGSSSGSDSTDSTASDVGFRRL